tara:strand:+ start:2768 stop:4483 length:1716 start_codon:yes stop_codon:yes gene_type:complete
MTLPTFESERLLPKNDAVVPKGDSKKTRNDNGAAPPKVSKDTLWGLSYLERQLEALEQTKRGSRNDQLNVAAHNAGRAVASERLNENTARERLRAVAVGIGLDRDEIGKTINSGLTAGKKKPMRLYDFLNSEQGNGERLVFLHGENIRFCPDIGGWLVWDEKRWKKSPLKILEAKAKHTASSMYLELARGVPEDKQKAYGAWAVRSQSRAVRKNMIEDAASEPGVLVRIDELDNNPNLLNVKNGTLDLTTRTLKPHDRTDLITKLADVDYDQNAKAPTWLQFQQRITKKDQSLQDFKAVAFAYSLLGNPKEHCFFICWGSGANGKSTEIETIAGLAGDYAKTTKFDTFIERRSDAIRNDLAALAGARLVSATEGSIDQRLAEGVVKSLTGGDKISARFLHQEFFDFTPTFVIWVSTNHLPVIRGTDKGMWRRIRLLPYTVEIPLPEQDKNLKDKLTEERAGILNWLIEGAEMYFAAGLPSPTAVEHATEEYRDSQDALSEFLGDNFKDEPGGFVSRKSVWQVYQEWCEENDDHVWKPRTFNTALKERGWVYTAKDGVRGWGNKTMKEQPLL